MSGCMYVCASERSSSGAHQGGAAETWPELSFDPLRLLDKSLGLSGP